MIAQSNSLILAFLLALVCVTNGGIIEDTKKLAENVQNEISKKIDETGICASNDMCNKNFFSINNYCCSLTCCNMFKYITNSDNYWNNFMDTVKNPRGINIIIGVSVGIIIALIVGLVVQLICCLCCGCCGSKKYVIVGRGD